MLSLILIGIVVLWFLGFVQIPYLHAILFRIFGHPVSLYSIILFLIIMWVIEILPSPFRQIISILFLLWILSLLGFITFAFSSQIIIVAIIIGVIISLF